MVKFAEAEKRGRGGDGYDRRGAPSLMERTKVDRKVWESLKSYIMKERQRKKQEMEADAEEKRMQKERENKKQQHAMTLEETREQIAKAKQRLSDLNIKKFDLLDQLKKVYTDEETRKKDHEQQQQQQIQLQLSHNYSEKSDIIPGHPYPHGPSLSIGGHPQMMFHSSMVQSRASNVPTLYKVGTPAAQPIQNVIGLTSGAVKPQQQPPQPRSPSPQPPQPSYHPQPPPPPLPYVFKSLPGGNQTSVVPVTLPPSRPFYHGSSPGTHSSPSQHPASPQVGAAVVAPYLTTPAAPPPPREDKQHTLHSLYHPGTRVPTSHVTGLHPTLPHKGKSPLGGGAPPPSEGAQQDKFYVRNHLVLRTVPVQQPQPPQPQPPPGPRNPMSSKGGVTSGFPVRGPLPPPTTQTQQGAPAPHGYSGHSINLPTRFF